MLEIIKPGLETSVQELPGRIGFWEQGFPPSGPVDAWSYRLANLLVGNHRDMAALEWQFIGPVIRFLTDTAIALTGAEQAAQLDGQPVACWQTIRVKEGQILTCGAAKKGARGYIAIAGGVHTQSVLGSRATFHMASIGGMGNGALVAGDRIPVGDAANDLQTWFAPDEVRPAIGRSQPEESEDHAIPVMAGPNDNWLDASGFDVFLTSEWTVLPQSNRTGIRLKGPELTFSETARDKPPEHGTHPSNILDHGYPLGGVSIAGQTPIIFINDSPSAGGFMVPFTVPSAAIWRLGQLRPGEKVRFRIISREEADELRKTIDALCTDGSLAAVSFRQLNSGDYSMHVEIKCDLPGVFYRSPAPGEPAFVNEGDTVSPETVVGMVELMKQFTEVSAGIAGVLESFSVNDGDDVDTDMTIAVVKAVG